MKIVSLLPSATEIVYALGLERHLEGVTFECDFPPEAGRKPVISNTSLHLPDEASAGDIDRAVAERMSEGEPLYVLDEARIRTIQPDLILAQDLCRVCAVPSGQVTDALDKLGCSARVISLDPATVDEVIQGLTEVGEAAGVEGRAEGVVASLRERIQAVESALAGLSRPATLALEWADPPFVGGHWVPEMIQLAGGRDVYDNAGRQSRRVAWDDLARAAPEVVVFMPCGYRLDGAVEQATKLYGIEAFAGTPAARAHRVFAVDASSYFSRPGPRIVDGVEVLAWILHPEATPQPPPGRVARIGPGGPLSMH